MGTLHATLHTVRPARASCLRSLSAALCLALLAADNGFGMTAEELKELLAAGQKVERVGKGPQIYSCGACNFRVRPQSVVEIANNGSLVLCDSCRRILYLE